MSFKKRTPLESAEFTQKFDEEGNARKVEFKAKIEELLKLVSRLEYYQAIFDGDDLTFVRNQIYLRDSFDIDGIQGGGLGLLREAQINGISELIEKLNQWTDTPSPQDSR